MFIRWLCELVCYSFKMLVSLSILGTKRVKVSILSSYQPAKGFMILPLIGCIIEVYLKMVKCRHLNLNDSTKCLGASLSSIEHKMHS
jgi:hypothetical protein